MFGWIKDISCHITLFTFVSQISSLFEPQTVILQLGSVFACVWPLLQAGIIKSAGEIEGSFAHTECILSESIITREDKSNQRPINITELFYQSQI